MTRRLFTIGWALALLLCLATAALWVRSLLETESITYLTGAGTGYHVGTAPHKLYFEVIANEAAAYLPEQPPKRGWSYARWELSAEPALDLASATGASTNPADNGVITYQFTYMPTGHSFAGFAWDKQVYPLAPISGNGNYTETSLQVPLWFVLGVFAVLPATRAWLVIRRIRRRRRGLCLACGFDLRATPDRCPECGIAPSKLGRGG